MVHKSPLHLRYAEGAWEQTSKHMILPNGDYFMVVNPMVEFYPIQNNHLKQKKNPRLLNMTNPNTVLITTLPKTNSKNSPPPEILGWLVHTMFGFLLGSNGFRPGLVSGRGVRGPSSIFEVIKALPQLGGVEILSADGFFLKKKKKLHPPGSSKCPPF